MDDMRTILGPHVIEAFRAAYRPEVMRGAMLQAIAEGYPPLDLWNRAIASTFYEPNDMLGARDRERCLIGILALTGPKVPLAIHVYWGLMEGLAVDEICHVVGLAACYGGVPRLAEGLPVVDRTLRVLATLHAAGDLGSERVLRTIIHTFAAG